MKWIETFKAWLDERVESTEIDKDFYKKSPKVQGRLTAFREVKERFEQLSLSTETGQQWLGGLLGEEFKPYETITTAGGKPQEGQDEDARNIIADNLYSISDVFGNRLLPQDKCDEMAETFLSDIKSKFTIIKK